MINWEEEEPDWMIPSDGEKAAKWKDRFGLAAVALFTFALVLIAIDPLGGQNIFWAIVVVVIGLFFSVLGM